MRNLKKLLSLTLVLALALSLVLPAFANDAPVIGDFPDAAAAREVLDAKADAIGGRASFEDAVQLMIDLNVMEGSRDPGTGAINLNLGGNLTRAEFIVMLWKAHHGGMAIEDAPVGQRYIQMATVATDPGADAHWGRAYINWAMTNDIAAGVGLGQFGPDRTITFNQAMLLAMKSIGLDTDIEAANGFIYPLGVPQMAFQIENQGAFPRPMMGRLFPDANGNITRAGAALLFEYTLKQWHIGYATGMAGTGRYAWDGTQTAFGGLRVQRTLLWDSFRHVSATFTVLSDGEWLAIDGVTFDADSDRETPVTFGTARATPSRFNFNDVVVHVTGSSVPVALYYILSDELVERFDVDFRNVGRSFDVVFRAPQGTYADPATHDYRAGIPDVLGTITRVYGNFSRNDAQIRFDGGAGNNLAATATEHAEEAGQDADISFTNETRVFVNYGEVLAGAGGATAVTEATRTLAAGELAAGLALGGTSLPRLIVEAGQALVVESEAVAEVTRAINDEDLDELDASDLEIVDGAIHVPDPIEADAEATPPVAADPNNTRALAAGDLAEGVDLADVVIRAGAIVVVTTPAAGRVTRVPLATDFAGDITFGSNTAVNNVVVRNGVLAVITTAGVTAAGGATQMTALWNALADSDLGWDEAGNPVQRSNLGRVPRQHSNATAPWSGGFSALGSLTHDALNDANIRIIHEDGEATMVFIETYAHAVLSNITDGGTVNLGSTEGGTTNDLTVNGLQLHGVGAGNVMNVRDFGTNERFMWFPIRNISAGGATVTRFGTREYETIIEGPVERFTRERWAIRVNEDYFPESSIVKPDLAPTWDDDAILANNDRIQYRLFVHAGRVVETQEIYALPNFAIVLGWQEADYDQWNIMQPERARLLLADDTIVNRPVVGSAEELQNQLVEYNPAPGNPARLELTQENMGERSAADSIVTGNDSIPNAPPAAPLWSTTRFAEVARPVQAILPPTNPDAHWGDEVVMFIRMPAQGDGGTFHRPADVDGVWRAFTRENAPALRGGTLPGTSNTNNPLRIETAFRRDLGTVANVVNAMAISGYREANGFSALLPQTTTPRSFAVSTGTTSTRTVGGRTQIGMNALINGTTLRTLWLGTIGDDVRVETMAGDESELELTAVNTVIGGPAWHFTPGRYVSNTVDSSWVSDEFLTQPGMVTGGGEVNAWAFSSFVFDISARGAVFEFHEEAGLLVGAMPAGANLRIRGTDTGDVSGANRNALFNLGEFQDIATVNGVEMVRGSAGSEVAADVTTFLRIYADHGNILNGNRTPGQHSILTLDDVRSGTALAPVDHDNDATTPALPFNVHVTRDFGGSSIVVFYAGDWNAPPLPVAPEVTFGADSIVVGATTQATATGDGSEGATIVWSSDDEAIATVDATTGIVTGVAAGTTYIIATIGGEEFARAEITVTAAENGDEITVITNAAISIDLSDDAPEDTVIFGNYLILPYDYAADPAAASSESFDYESLIEYTVTPEAIEDDVDVTVTYSETANTITVAFAAGETETHRWNGASVVITVVVAKEDGATPEQIKEVLEAFGELIDDGAFELEGEGDGWYEDGGDADADTIQYAIGNAIEENLSDNLPDGINIVFTLGDDGFTAADNGDPATAAGIITITLGDDSGNGTETPWSWTVTITLTVEEDTSGS